MSFNLSNRVAVVTGAASGIGQEVAVAFAKAGAKVAILDLQDASITVKKIEGVGGVAAYFECDVSDRQSVNRAVESVVSSFSAIHILVNNAGIFPFVPIEVLEEDGWDQVMNINAKSIFLLCKAVYPHMQTAGFGKIINVSSGVFMAGLAGAGAYAASKGAVIGLSRVLAREWGANNIQVNVITPGVIKTEGVVKSGLGEDFFNMFIAQQAVPRVGVPEDLAGTALLLASKESDFISGQIFNIDGGFIMH